MIRIQVIPLKKIIERTELLLVQIIFILIVVLMVLFVVDKRETFIEKMVSFMEYGNEEMNLPLPLVIVQNRLPVRFESQEIPHEMISNDTMQPMKEDLLQTIPLKENSESEVDFGLVEWEKPMIYDTCYLENGNLQVGRAIIKNSSSIRLDPALFQKPSDAIFTSHSKFLLFHTHTSETYEIPENIYTDHFRTQNPEYNMIAVGEALKEELSKNQFIAMHDCTIHDYPSYNGSYKASYHTVEQILQKESFDFVFDLHRDAISSNPHYRLSTTINGEEVAKLMFVVGSNGSGLTHERWLDNLKLAIMIQNKAEEMYPGFFREITLSNSRYNQQLSSGALIIEVGGTGNTLEEAKNAMKYLAEVFASMKAK